ncbi:neutral ceramidase precursor [Metarhizium guizhouense ARSEF 977]|uniref:Neutral ceramidase n=1 Tax=Metarhizium guizhouense (strain ARSEF 977) TaxID=1276136 RepID=A0A0B4H1P5_METGA|nr:neutral ceramidase precursor [Metarhizium guizhouense ARSEF 977]
MELQSFLSWLLGLFVVFLSSVPGVLALPGSFPEAHGPDWSKIHSRFASRSQKNSTQDKYLIGTGKADITGPAADIILTGYANLEQVGGGIRQRLFSRAFIIGDVNNPEDRIAYVVLDNLVGDTAIRFGVLDALKGMGAPYSVYGQSNVALAAAHSHSAPGGWNNYLVPQIPCLGFTPESYQAIVDGAVLSIKRAHESLQEGYLDVGTTEITDASINRSQWSYLQNPAEERARYSASTDTTMTLLRFTRASDNKITGLLNWFPVHGTSLYRNNTHVAGDNKGLAAWMTEQAMKEDSAFASNFVAAFSQANLGDATPNTEGAWCEDGSGKQCDFETATCADGTVAKCQGRGPHWQVQDQGASSCHEIALRQLRGVKEILTSMSKSSTPVQGPTVKSFHFFHNMEYWQFTLPNGEAAMTCPAALGYAFAAGTTDGRGEFDFIQGDNGKPHNKEWDFLTHLIKNPSQRQADCQKPKHIFLSAGELKDPYEWEPSIVDVMMFRVGQLVMILSPSEVTTMSGRRWKEAVGKQATSFVDDPIVVLGSPANTYAHYVATPEEYDVQRYEGASTIFGRHELDAYINLTVSNMHYLKPDATEKPEQGKLPPDNRKKSFNFVLPVIYDTAPLFKQFGQVLTQPQARYKRGDVVKAKFQGANPRNNLRLEGTFAAVEKQGQDGTWSQVADDADWYLVYTWRRTSTLLGHSEVDFTWDTSGNAVPGRYRFKYYGDAKKPGSGIEAFTGTSNQFDIS